MRIVNFSAGPCTLPLDVLEEVQSEFVDYHDAGMSIVEMSHRSAPYDQVHQSAVALTREVFSVPDDFDVVFIQGGATLQFGMLPMNLLTPGSKAAYVDTGIWASKAFADAGFAGDAYTAWSGKEGGYARVPASSEIEVQDDTRYVHITSNETIGGVQYKEFPELGVPLVADMSSDYMSRPVPWDRFDLVYGGVQKNLAPAGMALVILRRSILEETRRDLPIYLRYDIQAGKDSMYNTPPVFAIYVMEKVLKWMKASGGLAAMEQNAQRRADIIYGAIAASDGFYTNPIEPESRSNMNIVFRLADSDLEPRFVAEASAAGLSGLKGHRSVGGCRASVYNAMPIAGAEALRDFMEDFQARLG